MLSKSLIALFLATTLAVPPAFPDYILHEKRDALPERWVKDTAVDARLVLPMRIGLIQPDIHKGHDLLMDVSDPDSPNYGNWYSQEDVINMFAPAQHSVDITRVWLESSGIEPHRISQSVNKQWIQFDATVAEAEGLFKTRYHYYEHTSGSKNIACDAYHLPTHIAPHVDYITPGLRLMQGGKAGTSKDNLEKRLWRPGPYSKVKRPAPNLHGLDDPSLLALCDVAVTPICIQAEYNITKRPTTATKGNELGIFESLNDYLNTTDLQTFFAEYQAGIIPPTTRPILEGIDGGIDNQTGYIGEGESDIDFQVAYPIIHPQNTILFQTDDYNYQTREGTRQTEGFLNTFLDAVDGSYCKTIDPIDPVYPDPYNGPGSYKGKLQCGVYKPTNVISFCYGGQENDLPTKYQERQCNEFLKLGLQGVTAVFSSGDFGVAGPPGDANGNGCLGNDGKVFSAAFPATCPYVTSVGATVLVGKVQTDQEVAVESFASGGGFSNIYPIPEFQKNHIANYLAFQRKNTSYPEYSVTGTNYPTPKQLGNGIFNNAGRGFPDVAAVGDNVVVVYEGETLLVSGTSCAAPAFAAILTRINEERLKLGRKTIGFINPMLYKNDHVFHDITIGKNPGCGTDGFYATKGWDPLTGLGTPNYPALLELFLSH